MRRLLGLMALLLVLSAGVADARVEASQLILDEASPKQAADLQLLEEGPSHMRLEFRLPSLDLERIPVGDETFDALSIPGGGLIGEAGRAALPTFSRLVAVPEGVAVNVRVLSREERRLTGYRPLPMQPADAREFVMDRNWYAGGEAETGEEVTVGAPGILRDLRVVPVTFQPLRFDPASGELRAATHIELELDFSGTDDRNASVRKRNLIPESFDALYRDAVLGYRVGETQVGPGTILYISTGAVNSQIEPLLEWRRQQGYNVVHNTGGGGNTTAVKNIIQSAYNTEDPPLEFVVLVGDATGTYGVDTYNEGYSGYNGEGDHEYSLLAGGDWLADVHLGRLSFDSTSQLTGIVNKILAYEQSPPTGDAGWFTRGRLFGDPSSSGITTVWVNDWLKDQLDAVGFTDVTVTSSGNFVTNMTNAVNSGCSMFGYRGYWGMSGWSASGIQNTNNGGKSCFAVLPTCDSGSFQSDGMCRSEAFLRSTNGGGIGSVGTATLGTHTRYNNCFYMGIWEGAVNGSDHRIGAAHSRGKLELFNNYIDYETSKVYIWSTWNSLMGDPATDLHMNFPASFTVNYPSTIATGMQSIPVSVSDGGSPVAGALVCVYKAGQLSITAYTDVSGEATLALPAFTAGTVNVTVSLHGYTPHRGTLTAAGSASYVAVSGHTINDAVGGNGDSVVNPGESIELPAALTNYHSSAFNGVTADMSTDDLYVTVTDASETFGNISAGATAWSADDFDITVAAGAPDGHVIDLAVTAASGINTWDSLLRLTVSSAAFDYVAFGWGGGGSTLDPGESGTLTVTIQNNGSIAGSAISASLATTSSWAGVSDANGSYSNLGVGASGSNSGNTFALSISPDCFEGHLATFMMTLTFNGGATDVVEFSLPVGTASSNDPLGPDGYGYYAFDNTDTGYPWAPTYSWVEINPSLGGAGTDLGLNDFGWQQDDTNLATLPFTFQYYGEPFTQISICSNGWIAMGATDLHPYRNWSIPGAGNPDAMIAGFFDNLIQSGSNKVYTWNDTENSRFVIEWSQLRNDYSNAVEEFQIILFDPSIYNTATGDGPILVQYKTVNNTDSRDGYATAGIANLDGTGGLLYTYAADYAPAAATLAAGRAILYQPVGDLALGTLQGELTNASDGGAPVPGVGVRVVENNQTLLSGEDGSYAGSVIAGTYTVQVQHESFQTVTYNNVDIVEDQVTVRDFALTDILGPYIQNVTVLPDTDDTAGPYLVDVNFNDFSTITEMHLYYKLNGGGLFEAPLTLVDAPTGLYQGAIPGYPLSTQITYWLEAEDAAGNGSRNPATADTYFEFAVVPYTLVMDDDFETDQGWTVVNSASTGHWTRVDPIGVYSGGTPVQPEDDVSADGTLCYITGNAETGSQGADDVDGGSTLLYTPIFDLSNLSSASVSYYRWYCNDTGSNPDVDVWVVQVTDDDGANWYDLENTNVSQHEWVLMSFELTDYVTLSSTVQLRFIATDDANGSVVEAGLDEFLLSGFSEPDPTAAPGDAAPALLTLLQNMPNPFNPKTSIRFGLPAASQVDLKIYDAGGRLVKTLLAGETFAEGFHSVEWDGKNEGASQASSGIYFYVLEAGGERLNGKMVLLK